MKFTSRDCRGTFARGSGDNCPPNFLLDGLNFMTKEGNLIPRPGMQEVAANSKNSVTHLAVYQANPVAGVLNPKVIAHLAGGAVYNNSDFPATPIYTSAFSYHSWINFFGRGYFTLHNTLIGHPSEVLQVYEGGAASRNAAGVKPAAGMAGVLSGTPGNLGVGTYLVDVSYVTSSGFVTRRSGSPVRVDVFGSGQIDLTAIPTSGGQARQIVATKAISLGTYTGNPNDYEFFKVPGGLLNGVVTTYSVSFFDGDLSDSVEDLESVLATIPCGVGITVYNGRVLIWGESANPSIIRASIAGEPESFDEISGIIIVDPAESGGVQNVVNLRGTLYIFKANRMFYTIDNGRDPSTWEVKEFDSGVGTGPYGITQVLDSKGNHLNQFLIAARSGIVIFDGLIRYPELTFYIEDIWRSVDQSVFNQIQLALNPIHKHIYCIVPLNTGHYNILFGDYSNGMDAENIKWFLWENGDGILGNILSILVGVSGTNTITVTCGLPQALISFDPDNPSGLDDRDGHSDFPFFCHMQTPPLIFSGDDTDVQVITEVRMRQLGGDAGDITVQGISYLDPTKVGLLATMDFVTSAAIQDKWMYYNFVDMAPTIKFLVESTHKPKISRITIDGDLYGEDLQ